MSVISNIVLWCHNYDEKTVQKHLPIAGSPIKPDGGDKVFCVGLFAWAKNYLNVDEFLRELEALPWRLPSSVMLLIEKEEEECPAVYRLGETEPYGHNNSIEGLLDDSTDDDRTYEGVFRFVKVVKARAG